MIPITSSSLAQFILKLLDLYFTDSHKVELEKKIMELTKTIEKLTPQILKVDPCPKDKFEKWQLNPSILENSLNHFTKLKERSLGEKTDDINNIILHLQTVLSDQEDLFLNKTVGLTDWNLNKDYLNDKVSLLKSKKFSDKMLTCEEIITFLNLMPLNQCTSELGYYKEIARSVDEKGKSFTIIFYLLKSDEKSYFHKLDTNETWVWIGKNPLSLFLIENGHLIEHVLSKSNESIIIPSQTWFSAIVKEDKSSNHVEDDVPFALVTCHCIPSFTLNRYHDAIITDEEATISLINNYKKADSEMQTKIVELLAPQYQEEFKQRVNQ